ncbi:uncharacterized protein MKK02DRAFT_29037 [Dioszegia hungarica]|uniref:Uncharacterized protein n=1 Tax=Dioszegia hungarica TaxID=4972 RepID=A0AA38H1X1_9TREE|nr:uncharacterized protein MKK02DRAFT_29037 [Dioszegia hungarica]KAI9633137.1 hypothetical protein MKK02DRAFT_29037 [Dioszegia hungarica]
MPTEVSPAPFRYHQRYPISLEHPAAFKRMFGSNSPAGQGPARQMNMGLHQYQHPHQHSLHPPQQQQQQQYQPPAPPSYSGHPPPFLPPSLPMPHPLSGTGVGIANQVLPNGTRNPWAPYAGETYIPSGEKSDRMAQGQGSMMYGSPLQPTSSLGYSAPGSMSIPIPIPVPRSVVSSHGWAEGSISNSAAHRGAQRVDEGWDGSQGRAHAGHLPDPTTAAGRLGRILGSNIGVGMGSGGVQGWRQAPSSWQNHARLTPGLLPPPAPSAFVVMAPGAGGSMLSRSIPNSGGGGGGAEYLTPRSAENRTRPRRASFVLPGEECSECSSHGSPGRGDGALKRAGLGRSSGSGSGGEHRSGCGAGGQFAFGESSDVAA